MTLIDSSSTYLFGEIIMTTHSTIEVQDSSATYLLHAFSDGHYQNTVHAMLSLPGWIARKRHFWIADLFKEKYETVDDLLDMSRSMSAWSADWAGDVVAALVGFKPLWWVPWNYKDEDPPYYDAVGSKPDFTIFVTKRRWKVVARDVIPDGKAVCFDFSDQKLDDRIAELNGKISILNEQTEDFKFDLIKITEKTLRIPAKALWIAELWDMCNEDGGLA